VPQVVERKVGSNALRKWFSVKDAEVESDSSESSGVHDTKDSQLRCTGAASSEKMLLHTSEEVNPTQASLVLKSVLAVKPDKNAPGISDPALEDVPSGPAGLLASLGFKQKDYENSSPADLSPSSSPRLKSKFTFLEHSNASASKKTAKSRTRADSVSGQEHRQNYTESTISPKSPLMHGFVPVSVLKQNLSSKPLGAKNQNFSPSNYQDVSKSGVDLLARLFQTAGADVTHENRTVQTNSSQMTSVNDLESMIT
jgi:hypothetical protein